MWALKGLCNKIFNSLDVWCWLVFSSNNLATRYCMHFLEKAIYCTYIYFPIQFAVSICH